MFAKLAFLILSLGATAASLLAARQARLEQVRQLHEVQRRITESDRSLSRLRAEIARRVTPERIADLAASLGEMESIRPPSPSFPGQTRAPGDAGKGAKIAAATGGGSDADRGDAAGSKPPVTPVPATTPKPAAKPVPPAKPTPGSKPATTGKPTTPKPDPTKPALPSKAPSKTSPKESNPKTIPAKLNQPKTADPKPAKPKSSQPSPSKPKAAQPSKSPPKSGQPGSSQPKPKPEPGKSGTPAKKNSAPEQSKPESKQAPAGKKGGG